MSVPVRMAVLGVVLAAAAAIGLHWPLRSAALNGLALFLALTACVYLGALLAARPSGRITAAGEILVGGMIFLCAFLGLAVSPVWIAIGYGAHGAWDWLHVDGRFGVRVAGWFPPACAGFDFTIGAYTLVVL